MIIPYHTRLAPSKSCNWLSGEKELYEIFLSKNLPINEKYVDTEKNPITYTYNSFGYRSHVSINNGSGLFGYAIGCSNTFGSGLHIEDRYDSVISKELNIPIINLGIPGSSCNYVKEQVLQILSCSVAHPDFIIIEWPPVYRYTLLTENGEHILNAHQSRNTKEFSLYKSLVELDNVSSLFSYEFIRSRLLVTSLLEKLNIKYFEFLFDECTIAPGLYAQGHVDYARDGIHPGPETNKIIAKKFIEQYTL